MSDIIERLHSYSHARDFTGEPILAAELRRAADEITALRAQVAALTARVETLERIAKRWLAINAGDWNLPRFANEKAELLTDTRAALTVEP